MGKTVVVFLRDVKFVIFGRPGEMVVNVMIILK